MKLRKISNNNKMILQFPKLGSGQKHASKPHSTGFREQLCACGSERKLHVSLDFIPTDMSKMTKNRF